MTTAVDNICRYTYHRDIVKTLTTNKRTDTRQMKNVFGNLSYNTYKTQGRAIAKLEKVVEPLGEKSKFIRYIVAVNNEGRFFCVIINIWDTWRENGLPKPAWFVHNGLCVTN